MKINKKALELIESGLSSKTVGKLTESQINILHSKLVNEAITTSTTTSYNVPTDDAKKGVTLPPAPPGKKMTIQQTPTGIKATPTEEVTEDETDDVTDNSALGADALSVFTKQRAPHMSNDMAPDGMDDDSDDDRKMMGMSEANKKKNKPNPWAICRAQVGPKKTRKFERCVQHVKKQLSEGKNPVTLFLESQIMNIVEKHIPPRITKGDLLNYLSEDKNFATKHIQSFGESSDTETAPAKPKTKPTTKPSTKPKKPGHPGKNPNPKEHPAPKAKTNVEEAGPATAPTKPKPTTKPGTKPSTKPQKPAHPSKNPNPNENPAPKAKTPSAEQTKDKVIDVILNILKK